MPRQIILIKFKKGTTDSDIRAMGNGFSQLVDVVPGIRRFEFGSDLGLSKESLDYALVIDFDSAEIWRSCLDHPEHVAFAEKFIPRIEHAERVQ